MGLSIKGIIKSVIARGLYYSPFVRSAHDGRVLILMYHRVLPDDYPGIQTIQPGMYVAAKSFEMQMDYLSEFYEIIDFDLYFNMLDHGTFISGKRYCIITFDDGWLDNYHYAYPILKERFIRASIFLPTSYIGTDKHFWPDLFHGVISKVDKNCSFRESFINICGSNDLDSSFVNKYFYCKDAEKGDYLEKIIARLKSLDQSQRIQLIKDLLAEMPLEESQAVVSWEMVKEMSEYGITFGSHGHTHSIFTEISLDEVSRELTLSLGLLAKYQVKTVPVLCFPNGDFNDNIIGLVDKFNFRACVTTNYGVNELYNPDIYKLNRIGVHDDVSNNEFLFSLHLSTYLR